MDVKSQAIARIIAISRKELRQILQEAGGVECLDFPESYLEAHFNLPLPMRNKVLSLLPDLKAAVCSVTPADRLIFNSEGSVRLEMPMQYVEFDLIDHSQTLKQQILQEEHRRLEARYRHLVKSAKKTIAILDKNTTHLDCNFLKRRIGWDRDEAIGRTADELCPELADLAHTVIKDAFKYPETPVMVEFALKPVADILVKYRSEVQVFGDEAICITEPISPYSWVR